MVPVRFASVQGSQAYFTFTMAVLLSAFVFLLSAAASWLPASRERITASDPEISADAGISLPSSRQILNPRTGIVPGTEMGLSKSTVTFPLPFRKALVAAGARHSTCFP